MPTEEEGAYATSKEEEQSRNIDLIISSLVKRINEFPDKPDVPNLVPSEESPASMTSPSLDLREKLQSFQQGLQPMLKKSSRFFRRDKEEVSPQQTENPQTPTDEEESPKKPSDSENRPFDRISLLRKTGVAIAGGALIGVGIPLIPLPGPGDFMVVGGMALLATEFDGAKKVMDAGRDKLAEAVEEDPEEVMKEEEKWKEEKLKEEEERSKNSAAESDFGRGVKDMERGAKEARRSIKKQAKRLGRNILPFIDKLMVQNEENNPIHATNCLAEKNAIGEEEKEEYEMRALNMTNRIEKGCHNDTCAASIEGIVGGH